MQMVGFFDHGARLWPGRDCFIEQGRRLTYREVSLASHRVANGLRAGGVGIGSRVAVLSANDGLAFVAVLGALRAGATWLPVNARAAPAEMLAFLVRHRCDALFFHGDFGETARILASDAPCIRLLVCIDRELPAARSMTAWSAAYPAQCADADINRDHIAVIKPTGGTTGAAKSVMQTHGNFETMVATFLACMPFEQPPVHLVAAPMTHGAGSICFPLFACGASNVLLPKADPGAVLQCMAAHRVSVLFLPPTVIYMLLAHPQLREHDYSALKYFIYAAAPMSADKLRAAIEVFGPVMAQTYGQAEAPMLCTYLAPRDHRPDQPALAHRLLSCGRPTPFTRVEIMDEAGALLAPGEKGEIVVRGNLVFAGYFEDAEASREASMHGWHHTGDVGYRDEDGFVYIVDRKKDMIITGGFNVFPSEIEQVIWSHAAVQDCAVIGVPDAKWGEAVKAVIELKPGKDVTAAELIALCRHRLGGVKTPKSVEFWPVLPRSPVGKVLKKDIRQKFWTDQQRKI